MGRRGAGVVIAAAATCVLFSWVAAAGGVSLWTEPDWDPTPGQRGFRAAVDEPAEAEPPPPPVAESDPFELPEWLRQVLSIVLLAVIVAVSIAVARLAWHNRPRVRRRRRRTEVDFDVLPDVAAAAAVVREADAQRAALLRGSPRNAIVRCWLRLEHDVEAVGLQRRPADTSTELTARVLGRYSVDPDAIRDLAALYREARFSEHPLDESARRAALDALDRLHRTLIDGSAAATGTAAVDAGSSEAVATGSR